MSRISDKAEEGSVQFQPDGRLCFYNTDLWICHLLTNICQEKLNLIHYVSNVNRGFANVYEYSLEKVLYMYRTSIIVIFTPKVLVLQPAESHNSRTP